MSDHTEKTYPAAEMRHEIVIGNPDVVLQKAARGRFSVCY
jgi:hypothetical protein